jgi:eukaryotic-like serine/threonine-protein kinase
MKAPAGEDPTILPPTLLDDVAGAPTRLDPVPPASDLTVLDVPPDATVLVDDRVAERASDDRAATVLDAADAATLLDPGAARRSGATAPAAGAATIPGVTPPPAAVAAALSAAAPSVRYVVETLAGRGGMGTVHVARDVELLRRVALKELSLEVAHDRSARSRFVREVQVTAQLDHPHIVPVYGLEVASGGRPAYAMKLVEGQTFGQLIADARAAWEQDGQPDEDLALPARLEHFLKVCDAIAYAHDRGVVHRDLKPANLMLGRHNEVYVMDWGICRLLAQPAAAEPAPAAPAALAAASPASTNAIRRTEVSLEASHGETAYGAIVGTPLYMSPEQAQGRHHELDAKSDQCALGLILFELVTLKKPRAGKTLADVLTQAGKGERVPMVHAFGLAIPGELEAIVSKASAPAPADRYASVADFADDIRRYLRGDAVLARPDSPWQRAVRGLGRHRQAAALTLIGLIVASLATVAGLLWRHERALEAEDRRDRQIERLVGDVGEQGDRLQVTLLSIHDVLDTAVAAIGHAYEYGQPSKDPVLWDGDSHDARIGFEAAPGVSRASVESDARRVATVGASVTRVIDAVRQHMGRGSGPARGHQQVDGADTGLHELRAGFANGLKLTVPAAALERTAADMRTTPWYKSVDDGQAFHWALINADADAERELALSAPIVGDNGKRLGAAGLVVSLDHTLANLVTVRPVPDAKMTLLLAHDGTLLAAHTAAGGAAAGHGILQLLPVDQISAAIAKNEVGFIETDRLGLPHIVAFDTIEPVKWTLVVIADEAAVLARK